MGENNALQIEWDSEENIQGVRDRAFPHVKMYMKMQNQAYVLVLSTTYHDHVGWMS